MARNSNFLHTFNRFQRELASSWNVGGILRAHPSINLGYHINQTGEWNENTSRCLIMFTFSLVYHQLIVQTAFHNKFTVQAREFVCCLFIPYSLFFFGALALSSNKELTRAGRGLCHRILIINFIKLFYFSSSTRRNDRKKDSLKSFCVEKNSPFP